MKLAIIVGFCALVAFAASVSNAQEPDDQEAEAQAVIELLSTLAKEEENRNKRGLFNSRRFSTKSKKSKCKSLVRKLQTAHPKKIAKLNAKMRKYGCNVQEPTTQLPVEPSVGEDSYGAAENIENDE